MIAIRSRHSSLTLLAGVVVVQLLSPLQRGGSWTIQGVEHGWGGYIGLRSAQKENDAMRAELDRLKVRNAELEGRALGADRLGALLNFRGAHADTPMIA